MNVQCVVWNTTRLAKPADVLIGIELLTSYSCSFLYSFPFPFYRTPASITAYYLNYILKYNGGDFDAPMNSDPHD